MGLSGPLISSVSAFRRLPPPPATQSPTHSLSLTHTLTHTLTHSSLTHSHSSLTHTLTHSFTHSLTHSFTHSLTRVAGVGQCAFCVAGVGQCALPRGLMYALASLGAPPLLRGRRGTMCTAKGSDVRPGVPWGSASFAWQAWDNVHCQGV